MNWRRVFCALRLHYGHQKAGPFPVKGEEFTWDDCDYMLSGWPTVIMNPKLPPRIVLDINFEKTPLFSFLLPSAFDPLYPVSNHPLSSLPTLSPRL